MPDALPRVRRSRARGSRLPAAAVCVTRPSRYGNPFSGEDRGAAARAYAHWLPSVWSGFVPADEDAWVGVAREVAGAFGVRADDAQAVRSGRWLTGPDPFGPLRGRPLACWCPLPGPGEADRCHAAELADFIRHVDLTFPGPPPPTPDLTDG